MMPIANGVKSYSMYIKDLVSEIMPLVNGVKNLTIYIWHICIYNRLSRIRPLTNGKVGIFLSHTLQSKIIAPRGMSQYQNSPRISLETSVFYLNFQVRFFLAMFWTSRLDMAAEETWVRGQFSLYREWYGPLMYHTYPIPTGTPRLNLN